MFGASKSGKAAAAGGGGGGGTVTDAQIKYVTTLLTGDGTNGKQNNTFVDSSANNATVTRYGNSTQGSAAPFGSNWSNFFNGTSDYLTVPASSAFAPGTGDFTVEGWFNVTGTLPNFGGVIYAQTVSGANYFVITAGNDAGPVTANYISLLTTTSGGGTAVYSNSSNPFTLNTWNHFAVVRSSGMVTVYLNGIGGTPTSRTIDLTNTSYLPTIGRTTHSGQYFPGYISNLRYVKGTAVYTANFTPSTTPLTAVTNTSLLTCQSPYFTDNSANAFAVTLSGTPSVQRFSPFSNVVQTPQSYSTNFNGTSDYLTVAVGTSTNIPANTNFTFECWVYLRAHTSGYPCIFNNYSSGGGFALFAGHNGFGSTNYNLIMGGALRNSSSTIAYNTWTHIAVVRSGTGTNNCTFYINGVAASGATYTDNSAITSVGTNNWIGTAGDSTTSSYIDGYISNMRLVNGTAVYTANFTPPTAPLTAITNTSLLTCQNATIKDNSTNAFAITATGAPTPKAVNPFGFTTSDVQAYDPSVYGGSMYFDGAGDYLSVPASAGTDFGTGNFTIEMWIKPSSLTNYNMVYAGGGYLALLWGATASVFGLNANNAAQDVSSSTLAVPINQWTHIAFVRSSGTLYFYINGVASGSGAFASAFGTSTGTVSVAYNPAYAGSYYTNAGISNLRIVKGTAVYTANFTPPTAPVTAITGTQLLLNGTNAGVIDSSMQTVFETVGNAQISTTQKKFGTGSIYFDGTGDGLVFKTTPNMAMGTGDFTVEFWIYPSATQANFTKYFCSGTSVGSLIIDQQSSSNTITVNNNSSVFLTSSAISNTTWTHVAVVRNGTTLSIYLNGTLSASVTNTTNFVAADAQSSLGCYPDGSKSLNGYIDDFRITKGFARYTANFTPPTAALPTS
jgi:hypothetical protein